MSNGVAAEQSPFLDPYHQQSQWTNTPHHTVVSPQRHPAQLQQPLQPFHTYNFSSPQRHQNGRPHVPPTQQPPLEHPTAPWGHVQQQATPLGHHRPQHEAQQHQLLQHPLPLSTPHHPTPPSHQQPNLPPQQQPQQHRYREGSLSLGETTAGLPRRQWPEEPPLQQSYFQNQGGSFLAAAKSLSIPPTPSTPEGQNASPPNAAPAPKPAPAPEPAPTLTPVHAASQALNGMATAGTLNQMDHSVLLSSRQETKPNVTSTTVSPTRTPAPAPATTTATPSTPALALAPAPAPETSPPPEPAPAITATSAVTASKSKDKSPLADFNFGRILSGDTTAKVATAAGNSIPSAKASKANGGTESNIKWILDTASQFPKPLLLRKLPTEAMKASEWDVVEVLLASKVFVEERLQHFGVLIGARMHLADCKALMRTVREHQYGDSVALATVPAPINLKAVTMAACECLSRFLEQCDYDTVDGRSVSLVSNFLSKRNLYASSANPLLNTSGIFRRRTSTQHTEPLKDDNTATGNNMSNSFRKGLSKQRAMSFTNRSNSTVTVGTEIGMSYHEIGLLLYGQCWYSEALVKLEQSLKVQRKYDKKLAQHHKTNRLHHTIMCITIRSIGYVHCAMCQYSKAMQHFNKALQTLRYLRKSSDKKYNAQDDGTGASEEEEGEQQASAILNNSYNDDAFLDTFSAEEDGAEGNIATAASIATVGRNNSIRSEIASTLRAVGNVHAYEGRYGEALENYKGASSLQREQLSDSKADPTPDQKQHDREDLALTLRKMGNILRVLGRVEESTEAYRQGMELTNAGEGEHANGCDGDRGIVDAPMLTPSSLEHTGLTMDELLDRGDYEAMLERYSDTFRAQQRLLGREHIKVAETLNNIGLVNACLLRYDDAMEHFAEALRILQCIFKGGNGGTSSTASDAVNVTSTIVRLGGNMFTESPLPTHDMVAATLELIANIHTARTEYDPAMAKHSESLRFKKALLGKYHPRVADSYVAIGCLLLRRSEHDRALHKFEEALRIRRRAFGANHVAVARALDRVGDVERNLDRHTDAMMRHLEALRIKRICLGADHPSVAYTQIRVAEINVHRGRYDRALDLYEEALALILRDTKERKGEVAEENGYSFDGDAQASQRASLQRKVLRDEDSRLVVKTLRTVGNLYTTRGEYSKGLNRLQQALEIQLHQQEALDERDKRRRRSDDSNLASSIEADRTPEYMSLARTYRSIGQLHVRCNQYEAAMKAMNEAARIVNERREQQERQIRAKQAASLTSSSGSRVETLRSHGALESLLRLLGESDRNLVTEIYRESNDVSRLAMDSSGGGSVRPNTWAKSSSSAFS